MDKKESKNNCVHSSLDKENESGRDVLLFDYSNYRLEDLAKKIKLKNIKPCSKL